jgi:thioredoxin reductase
MRASRMTTVTRISPVPLDALIVGGGPAGLSTALVLGRARKRVLVVDAGQPANAAVTAMGGLLGQPSTSPFELRRHGHEQLAELETVEVRVGEVAEARRGLAPESRSGKLVAARPDRGAVAVTLADGTHLRARTLVLAHGLHYDPPAIPGIEPLSARSVFHCPFCDGWEVRDQPLALHGNGPDVVRSALNLASWSHDVLVCTDGPADLGPGGAATLEGAGITVRDERINRLEGEGGKLRRIHFERGAPEARAALFVRTTRRLQSDLAATLGCALTSAGTIVTDGDGRTSVPGVYAAGDAATSHLRSVANAIGSGARAAYSVALDLIPQLDERLERAA